MPSIKSKMSAQLFYWLDTFALSIDYDVGINPTIHSCEVPIEGFSVFFVVSFLFEILPYWNRRFSDTTLKLS